MKLITRQSMANEAHAELIKRYPECAETIGKKLLALGENPSPDAVDAVIGNSSWTMTPRCDECGSEEVPVVQVGEEPDYESNTAILCESCLTQAVSLFTNKEIT